VLFAMIGYLFIEGVHVWGVNVPNGWGFAIVNFVFWVGIGHAGTLISAILCLFRQKWRTSINRFAEAMTIFAVMCAGIFPAIHVGRVWVIYWVFPVPNQMLMWPNFRSPLIWDVFAVSAYATVSLLFWYMGMIPDLATLRDRATTKIRKLAYGIAAMGWRGSQRHWHRYEVAYLLLAALAAPLVLSVHSVVSFDFAVSQLPGWHTTVFPPYFVVGAVFSGFAMVLMLLIPARQWFGLKEFVTRRHLDNMAKIILVTGSIVGFAYLIELFMAWYSGNPYEQFAFLNRMMGPYAFGYWLMVGCNVLAPQLFWFRKVRQSIPWLLVIAVLVNVGMWFERFVIVITSLSRDFLPGSWDPYIPTWVDYGTLIGSFGLFFFLFLLFVRYLPMMAMAEVKAVMHGESHENHHGHEAHAEPEEAPEPEVIPAEDPRAVEGILVEFDDPDEMTRAAAKVRSAGWRRWDAYSPFPVHGLDKAMGIRRTMLPVLVFGGGVTGCLAALGLQWFTNAFDYKFLISGKPFFSLPAFIPVTFELTVLLAAFGAFFGMLALNGLPKFWHAVFTSKNFRRATSDRFFIFLEAKDREFQLAPSTKFAAELGGSRVEVVEA
jgi:molybdopterin-containing oxidoreductase family membrane subunit